MIWNKATIVTIIKAFQAVVVWEAFIMEKEEGRQMCKVCNDGPITIKMIIVKEAVEFNDYLKLGFYPRLKIPRCCPSCKSLDQLRRIGYYKRWVCTPQVEKQVRIGRVICKSCKTTHALLPSFLIPRRQDIVGVIAKFLSARVLKSKSLRQSMLDCGAKNPSRQKGAHWLKKLYSNFVKLSSYVYTTYHRAVNTSSKDILHPLIYLLLPQDRPLNLSLSLHNFRFYTQVQTAIL